MRITRKVFQDLAIWMMLFGFLMGVFFPFFKLLLGVSRELALTPAFFGACIAAGVVVGAINYSIAKGTVGSRLHVLAAAMGHVEEGIKAGGPGSCTAEECVIPVDSDDEIGESARAFNSLVETLAHSLDTQRAVRSFFEMLTSNLDLGILAKNALEQFMEHAGASGGAIVCELDGAMDVAASCGLADAQRVAASDLVATAFKAGGTQVVQIPAEVVLDGVLTEFRPREVLLLPAAYKGVPLGVVVLAAAQAFDGERRLRAELFAQGLGLALNSALAHERLQRVAALDPLTGVYNRRFGLSRLHEEFERAVRAGMPLGVLMMDIDHFKPVNDTYGHSVGDRLLKSVAVAVRSVLREGDILLRYGGEEFLAVLPAASSEDVAIIGERIRRSVEDLSISHGQQSIRVTMSLGGAALMGENVDKEDSLVNLADQALYRAKQTGRNKVELAN
jgi:diguanylate cyclase (GGDEF)-like protein